MNASTVRVGVLIAALMAAAGVAWLNDGISRVAEATSAGATEQLRTALAAGDAHAGAAHPGDSPETTHPHDGPIVGAHAGAVLPLELPPGHPEVGVEYGSMPANHPGAFEHTGLTDAPLALPSAHDTLLDNPHAFSGDEDVPASPNVGGPGPDEIERAPGPRGKRIAELHRQGGELSGQTVQVRARVVKIVEGVLGTNFVHLRDGSGTSGAGDDDLTAAMAALPELGATLTIEGSIVTNHDVGLGYSYSVFLRDARAMQ
jgi:hypothetical protein